MNNDIYKKNKSRVIEQYLSYISNPEASQISWKKEFKNIFEKYVNEDSNIEWKNAFPKRFNAEMKGEYFIRQIDFIDVLSNPKPTENDIQRIIMENNVTPHLDGNGNPIALKSQSDLESKQNKRKLACYGLDKNLWFNFQQEGFIFDDLPEIPRRSLCIPFEPGMNGAWAPNGYGKSFIFGTVFQTLRKSFSKGAPVESFERFLTKLTALTNENPEREVPIFTTNPQPTKPLIPFRQVAIGIDNHLNSDASFAVLINVEFDDAGSVESYSLSLDMGWSPEETADNDEAVNIPKWILLSESSTFGSSKFTGPTDVERIRNLLNANRWELVALTLFTQLHLTYVEIPKLAYNANMFVEIKSYVKDVVSDLIQYKPAEFASWPFSPEIQAQIFHELQQELNTSIVYNTSFEEKSEADKILQIKSMVRWCFVGENFKEAVHHYLNAPEEKYRGTTQPTALVEGKIEVMQIGESTKSEMSSISRIPPPWYTSEIKVDSSALIEIYEDAHDYLTNKLGDTLYLVDAFVEDDQDELSPPHIDGESNLSLDGDFVKRNLSGTSLGRALVNNWASKSNFEYIKNGMREEAARFEEILPLVEANINTIIERMEKEVSKKKIIDFERSLNSVISSDGPWGIKIRLMNWGSNLGAVEPMILHQAEDENQRVSWPQLSFGQKSELIIEGVLAKEQQESRSGNYQRCLVIDEPEAGRSEHWINELILKLSERSLSHMRKDRNSVLVLSHRGLLLNEVFEERGYHVMHYVDMDISEEE